MELGRSLTTFLDRQQRHGNSRPIKKGRNIVWCFEQLLKGHKYAQSTILFLYDSIAELVRAIVIHS